MFVPDAIAAFSDYVPEPRQWLEERPIQESVATFCIGDHGDQWQIEKPSPAKHEAILGCGCSRFFPVPPMDGELLHCALHDDWYRSRPAVIKPKTEWFLKCNSCPKEYPAFDSSSRVHDRAKRHSLGSKGGRANDPHEVLIGKRTEHEFVWKKYERKN